MSYFKSMARFDAENPFPSSVLIQMWKGSPPMQYEQPYPSGEAILSGPTAPALVNKRPITVVDFDGSLASEIGKPGVIYRRAHPLK